MEEYGEHNSLNMLMISQRNIIPVENFNFLFSIVLFN